MEEGEGEGRDKKRRDEKGKSANDRIKLHDEDREDCRYYGYIIGSFPYQYQ